MAAQIGIHAALDDSEALHAADFWISQGIHADERGSVERARAQAMVRRRLSSARAASGGILGAFVEGHDDVGAESDLDVDRMLGSKEVRAAVEVRAEADAFIGDFAQGAEREDLESAGVGKQGARPTDEAVQAAHAANDLVARAKVEMIGVAENDFGAEGFEHILRDGFDRSLRTDRHEDGRFDGLMRQSEARAAAAGCGFSDELERWSHSLILAGGEWRTCVDRLVRRRARARRGLCRNSNAITA